MIKKIPFLILALIVSFNLMGFSAQKVPPIVVSSSNKNGSIISYTHVRDGQNKSPYLKWQNPELAKTKSYVVICFDKDAPMGVFYHWLMFNIPKDKSSLEQGQPKIEKLSNGALQGKNSFGDIGYDGPAPPPGKVHHYYFVVMALDTMLSVRPGCTYLELAQAFQKHIIASGAIMFEYFR